MSWTLEDIEGKKSQRKNTITLANDNVPLKNSNQNMENICSNFVQFTGEPQALREIQWLFKAMSALEKESGLGQIPSFTNEEEGLLFGIDFFDNKIYYETKSTPNIAVLVEIADRFQAGFTVDYHDLGQALFGEAKYEHGRLTDTRLDIEDFEKFNYDLEKQVYMYEGHYYDSDAEILEIMLETKKDQLNNSFRRSR